MTRHKKETVSEETSPLDTQTIVSSFNDSDKSHDSYFKRVLKDPEMARQWLTTYLPKDLVCQINSERLEFYPLNLVTSVGGELTGDFAIKTEIAGNDGFVIVAIEHQSSNDGLMALRMLEYHVYLLRQHCEGQLKVGIAASKVTLPLVIQMVAYHGRTPCTMSNDLRDYVEAPRELIDAYFLKPFQIIDFTQLDDEVLKRQELIGLFGLSLKYSLASVKTLPAFLDALNFFVEKFQQLEALRPFFMITMEYFLKASSLSDAMQLGDILKVSEKISRQTKEEIMTLAQRLRNEGLEKGLQKGRQEGEFAKARAIALSMLSDNEPLVKIARYTGLSETEIEQLRTKH